MNPAPWVPGSEGAGKGKGGESLETGSMITKDREEVRKRELDPHSSVCCVTWGRNFLLLI